MIFVTKHITAKDKDRKKRLKQLEQDKSKEALKKLDELQGIAETKKTIKQIENSMFAINPIGSKINSFMNDLSSNNSDSQKDESSYYRDFYGRKRKRPTTKRDLHGRKITKGV